MLTPKTEFTTLAVADGNVRDLKTGEIIQFERVGYFIVDKAWGEVSRDVGKGGKEDKRDRVELILIPDGKASSTASKATGVIRLRRI